MILGSELHAMLNNMCLIARKALTLAPLLMALNVAEVLAQEVAEATEEPRSSEATATTDLENPDSTDTPATNTPGAVLDYEPTESISEDLSVSFPVDI